MPCNPGSDWKQHHVYLFATGQVVLGRPPYPMVSRKRRRIDEPGTLPNSTHLILLVSDDKPNSPYQIIAVRGARTVIDRTVVMAIFFASASAWGSFFPTRNVVSS